MYFPTIEPQQSEIKEGYSERRRILMKDILTYIHSKNTQIEIQEIKNLCPNAEDYFFLADRLALMGIAYFKDCGLSGHEDVLLSLKLALDKYGNVTHPGFIAEKELLESRSPCYAGFPLKIPSSINYCDLDCWTLTIAETALWDSLGKLVLVEGSIESVYVVPSELHAD